MTEELAKLLRKAAEKWPEKFQIRSGILFMRGESFSDSTLEKLDDKWVFTLDKMDAIAIAVGMRFTVNMNSFGHYRHTVYTATVAEDWKIVGGTDYNYEWKREASIAALCAILKYKLENLEPKGKD